MASSCPAVAVSPVALCAGIAAKNGEVRNFSANMACQLGSSIAR
ncbi:Uncharacterised protein [Mycobacteroides abscessus subsp. abscessus]|nr:Uncharacterised protein [Mycobacteroides abscessus subsp. abscessus]